MDYQRAFGIALSTTFDLDLSAIPQTELSIALDALSIPAYTGAPLPVAVLAPAGGIYQLNATVQGGAAQDSAPATLTVLSEPGLMIGII